MKRLCFFACVASFAMPLSLSAQVLPAPRGHFQPTQADTPASESFKQGDPLLSGRSVMTEPGTRPNNTAMRGNATEAPRICTNCDD